MKLITLTKGQSAIVDDIDYEYLNQFKWCTLEVENTCYAIRMSPMIKGVRGKMILMHREILNTPFNMKTDHRDRNGLNNQRQNLRICTHRDNMRNIGPKNGRQYIGTKKNKNQWQYRFRGNDGRSICCGRFKTEKEAAIAYNKAVLEYGNPFIQINEITPD